MTKFLNFLLLFGVAAAQDELLLVQLFHRHGSKIPDIYDPPAADLWESYAPLDPGYLSPLGETEMRSLGRLLRNRYIDSEPLLPDEFDQNTLYARTSSFNTRPMRSIESLLPSLYPNAPIPVYTVNPWKDELMLHTTCPSYLVETKQKLETLDASWSVKHAELIGNMTRALEWPESIIIPDIIWFEEGGQDCAPLDCPSQFLWWYAEELQCMFRHGYENRLDPYIFEHSEEIRSLHSEWELEILGMHGPDDPRGPSYGKMARNIMDNIQMAIEGTSGNKMYIYAMHSIPMTQLRDALHLGGRETNLGNGLLIELRRRSNGEYYLKAEVLYPNDDGTEYISEIQPLRCPTFQETCALEDFMFYIGRRASPPGEAEGCCFRGQSFFDRGCGDYLNPQTLNIPECKLYRDWCPQVACGENQVVDSATLLCVPIA